MGWIFLRAFHQLGSSGPPRKVYHAAIKEAGGQPLENVTSKRELLVVGDDPGSKAEKAKAAGVPICTLDECKEALAKRVISLPQPNAQHLTHPALHGSGEVFLSNLRTSSQQIVDNLRQLVDNLPHKA